MSVAGTSESFNVSRSAAPGQQKQSAQSARFYLDYAATAPLRPDVLQAMFPWLGLLPEACDGGECDTIGGFGNANALYAEGKVARRALEDARSKLAYSFGAKPTEITFTSGGTEADTAAIVGITSALRATKGKAAGNHLVYAAFEHSAVTKAMLQLKAQGFQASVVAPRPDGFIHVEDLVEALRPDTMLVSVMLLQNEIGTIQPIAQLAAAAHRQGALFHCDAVQALGKLPLDLAALGVDAASFSAHKIGGPKGAGALYLRAGTPFVPLQKGGGQESGRRGGTQDVASAVGFAAAADIACNPDYLANENARLATLRDTLVARLMDSDPRIALAVPLTAGDISYHASSILSLLIEGQQSEMMVLHLDEAGIAASGGSACSSASLDPSPVLLSLGVSKERAYGSLRLSLGWASSERDVDALCTALPACLTEA